MQLTDRQRNQILGILADCDAQELYWQGRWAAAQIPSVRAVAAKKIEQINATRAKYAQSLEE
jgi:hypothetical protein